MTKTSSTRSIASKALAALALSAVLIAGSTGAEAKGFGHHGGRGLGLGIGLGVGLLGAVLAADAYNTPRSCYVQPRYDEYGNFIGRVRVCN